jgi:hypothetical protein
MKFLKLLPLIGAALLATAAAAGPITLTYVQEPSDHPWTVSGTITLPDDNLITEGRYLKWFADEMGFDPMPDGLQASGTATLPVYVQGELVGSATGTGSIHDGWWSFMDLTYLGDNKARGGFAVQSGDDYQFNFQPPSTVEFHLNSPKFEITFSSPDLLDFALREEGLWVVAALTGLWGPGFSAPGYWQIENHEVPEPGTLLLLTGALAGLALSRRRKQS